MNVLESERAETNRRLQESESRSASLESQVNQLSREIEDIRSLREEAGEGVKYQEAQTEEARRRLRVAEAKCRELEKERDLLRVRPYIHSFFFLIETYDAE